MAKYKNRDVAIIREIPHGVGSMVEIEHREPGVLGREVVPAHAVVLTKDEKKVIDEARKTRIAQEQDFIVEGDEQQPGPAPTVPEVQIQRMAERNLELKAQRQKEAEEYRKNHPETTDADYRALEAVKVVPYKDETKKVVSKDYTPKQEKK